MTPSPADTRARIVEELRALGQIARDVGDRRARAERAIAEAEAEMLALGRIETFLRVNLETTRARLATHDLAQKGTPS